MQKQRAPKVKILMVAALLYPVCALAQTGGNSGSGASAGSRTTTGIASDQAHIPPPGTNSLGTANSSGITGGTVGANMEPKDSRRIDTEIQNENSRIDSKINGICRGC
jgi:hypothetical protein